MSDVIEMRPRCPSPEHCSDHAERVNADRERDRQLGQLDARLDTLTEQVSILATSLAVSARTAQTGGQMAGVGGAVVGLVELVRVIGPALGWW